MKTVHTRLGEIPDRNQCIGRRRNQDLAEINYLSHPNGSRTVSKACVTSRSPGSDIYETDVNTSTFSWENSSDIITSLGNRSVVKP